ncbi:hypothetical protein BDD12DRAFT_901166 [Trichophaea hybrida]|nr:hypothetical protein BDD12DRAFT_901166 [Trichophaea hybrida]
MGADSVEILSHRVVGFLHSGPEDSNHPTPDQGVQNATDGNDVTVVLAQSKPTNIIPTKKQPNGKSDTIIVTTPDESELRDQSATSTSDVSVKKEPRDQYLLATVSEVPLDLLFAQEMFSSFMLIVAKALPGPIQGRTTTHNTESSDDSTSWQSFTLQNTTLSRIAHLVHRAGLGSLEDVYISIIPPLSIERKLPVAVSVIELARQNAKHELAGHWKEAGDIYLWLFEICKTFGSNDNAAIKATAVLLEFLRSVIITLNPQCTDEGAIQILCYRCVKGAAVNYHQSIARIRHRCLSNIERIYMLQARIERSGDLKKEDWEPLRGDICDSSKIIPPANFGFNKLHEIVQRGEYSHGPKVLVILAFPTKIK